MSESIFFEWLDIDRFRGFADAQHINLEASVIILWGPNGTGKTSFFDAVQWLLVGSIDRLESWRVKRNAEHIVNRYSHASGDAAVVAAGVRIGDRQVELRRSGRYDASQLEWRDESGVLYEEQAEAALAQTLTPTGRVSLKRSLLSSGLLQQDVIREVLEDKPSHRYDHLAAILGLDSIADFPLAAKRRAERLATEGKRARQIFSEAESNVRAIEDRIGTLRARVAKSPDLAGGRDEFLRRMESRSDVLRLRSAVPSDPTEAADLRSAARAAAELMAPIEAEADEIRKLADVKDVPISELEPLKLACEETIQAQEKAELSAKEAEKRYREEQAFSDRMSRLAKEALPLLGDVCPVCRQTIVEGEVHQHLEQLVESGSASLEDLERKRSAAVEALQSAEEAAESAQGVLAAANARVHEFSRASDRRAKWREMVEDIFDRYSAWLLFPMQAEMVEGNAEAISAARAACEDLSDAATELHAALTWSPETGPLTYAQEQMTELQAQVKEARDAATAGSAAEEEGKVLQRAAVRAVASITEDRFDVLRPVIQDIYSRLDPHPTFNRLQFAVEVYREKGIASPEVLDVHAEVDADPLLVFSSSQANVVALSAFLALGWAAGEDSMPFLLLDDPLQSLDDVNALGFADLCRHMRTRRQLIVSTHDERLASLLTRKLAPRQDGHRSRVLRFVAWNRSGPIIEAREIEPQLDQSNRLMLTEN